MWLGYEAESAKIAQTDASQDDEAKFPAGGFHHWCIVEPDENECHKDGGQKTKASEDHGSNRFRVSPV